MNYKVKNQLFCPIRRKWLVATPEEIVRQKLLTTMIEELGYPQALIAVEKRLNQLPHLNLSTAVLPERRIDILCFSSNLDPDRTLLPLILIECKKENWSIKSALQVLGYNRHVNAQFITLASQDSIQTVWFNPEIQSYQTLELLPTYEELLQLVKAKQRLYY